jgi:hypothetical protein
MSLQLTQPKIMSLMFALLNETSKHGLNLVLVTFKSYKHVIKRVSRLGIKTGTWRGFLINVSKHEGKHWLLKKKFHKVINK